MILHDRFTAKLQQALNERGWSKSELARRMGMTRQAIHQYVHGTRCPGLDLVAEFEAAVGAESGSLVDRHPLQLLELAETE